MPHIRHLIWACFFSCLKSATELCESLYYADFEALSPDSFFFLSKPNKLHGTKCRITAGCFFLLRMRTPTNSQLAEVNRWGAGVQDLIQHSDTRLNEAVCRSLALLLHFVTELPSHFTFESMSLQHWHKAH